jgi:hypothetical protein
VFAWAIYNSLKNTPPKDYPTTGEIKSTISGVLPALKEHLAAYLEKVEEAEDLSAKVVAKEITEEQVKVAVDKINEVWRAYNKANGNEVVEIALDDEGFKTLRAQFDREGWGKKWLANIEEFGELLAAFDVAGK